MMRTRELGTQVERTIDDYRGLIAALEVTAATLATTVIVATLAWQTKHYFAMPFYDDIYDRLRLYRALPHITALMKYFISAHNEHRILTSRLFAFFDEFVFSGREYTQVIMTNGLQLCSAWVVYRLVFHPEMGKAWGVAEKFLALTTSALLFINPNFLYTLIIPFQLQHAIMAFLCVISAWLVSRATPSRTEKTRLAYPVAWLLVLALIATFTLGNAPAILIGAAATAFVLRWEHRLVLLLTAMAVAHTAIVLATTTAVGTPTYNPFRILKFALIYWGAPFLRFDPWPSTYVTWWSSAYLAGAFGAIVLGTSMLFAFLRLTKPGFGGRTAVFGFMILMIVIVTGVAAAHSRGQFGILEAANKKYASFAALGWLGVLAVLSGIACHRLSFLRRPEIAVFALMLALLLPLTALGYARETRLWQKDIDRNWEASLAAFLQINDRGKLHDLYTEELGLGEYLGYIKPNNRGIFSRFRFRWGDDAKVFLSARQKTSCRSEVEAISPIATADLTTLFHVAGEPVSISGWAWMDKNHQPPAMIIAVDSHDRIVGAGRVTRASARAEEWLGQKLDQNAGWFGFARLVEPPPVTFFALSRDGEGVCALGGFGNVQIVDQVKDSGLTKASLFDQILNQRPEATSETSPVQCDANIDFVNGAAPSPTPAAISKRLTVEGWTAMSGKDGTVPDEVFLTLSNSEQKLYVKTRTTPRADVKEHYNHPKMPDPGFTADIDVSTLNGKYALGLSRVYKGRLDSCRQFNIPLLITR